MDGIGQEQHPDAVAEVGQRLGQGLAVLATLGEAAARLAAEEMRRTQRREEDAENLRAARDDRQADRLAQHAASRREPGSEIRPVVRLACAQPEIHHSGDAREDVGGSGLR